MLSGWPAALLLALAAGCGKAAAFECEARVLRESGGSLAPVPGGAGECLPALFGPHVPFNADFDRPLARASPADGCSELSGAPLSGSIALFELGGCSALDAALRAQARGAHAALFAARADQPFRRSTAGWLDAAPSLTIPVLLVSHEYGASALVAAATHLRLRLAARELRDGAPLSATLAAERDAFFTYALAERADLTVVVSAAAGDPDLYGNRAQTLDAVALPPGTLTAQFQAAQPGDDLLSIRAAEPGAYIFAVNAFSQAANFTIQLAPGAAELALRAGQPMRVDVARSELRYLKHTFAPGTGGAHPSLRFALTAFTGNVTLWACADFQPAPEGRASCAWTTSGRAAPVLDILPTDARALQGCAPECTYHLVLRAQSAASVALSLSSDGGAIELVDGSPELGAVGPDRPSGRYTVRTTDGALELVATPARGAVELRVREPLGGRTVTLGAASTGAGGAVVRRAFGAAELCANCDVEIEVLALRAQPDEPLGESVFSLAASTSGGIATLEDGAPRLGSVAQGGAAHFRVRVQDAATDLRLVLTPLTGNPDLYASLTLARPNASHHDFSAASPTGNDVLSISHSDPRMAACTAGASSACIVSASVYGTSASTFTLTALLSVANDGLRIVKPASARADLVFSDAIFGLPLPFEGEPLALVAVAPRDACAELGPASLARKIALVDRGGCVFIDKVLHAQARGAAAVVVANDEEGPPLRMGLPAEPPGEEVLIPAVMVSKADGERLRALLAGGSAVELVMQQPGDRPVQLLDGVPQEAQVEAAQLLFFAVHVPEGATELTVRLTPELGDADLFISNDGLPPTQTHHGWASMQNGEDSVTIGAADARFCAGCTYYIGVLGFSDASFSVVASTSDTAVLLQLGMPLTSRLRADEWAYFTLLREDASRPLHIALTALTGDPDLYASALGRPSRSSHQYAATSWGDDTLVIQPGAPGAAPGPLHLGVAAYVNTTFTLTATLEDAQAPGVLVAGRPQLVTVRSGEWQHFRLSVGPNATRVAFSAAPLFGDPDIFVTTDGSVPTKQRYDFSSNRMGTELVEATAESAAFCAGCEYLVGVFGFTGSNLTLSATVEYGGSNGVRSTVVALSDGLPVQGAVGSGEMAYFRFFVDRTDMAVRLTLTAFSGDSDLYASFDNERPTALAHAFSSSALGGDVLSISHLDARFCKAAPCVLHVGVHGASESRFALVATQYEDARLTLLDGIPQHGALGPSAWQYYAFTLSESATSLRFSLSPSFGDPDLYVSTAREPSRDDYQWRSSKAGADEVLIDHNDLLWVPPPATYRVGVYAWHVASNYSLVAASEFAQTLLEDGAPVRGSVRPGGYEYYKLHVDDNATDLEVIVTPLSGNPDVFASHAEARPNRSSHEFASSSHERDVLNVAHTTAQMASCTGGAQRCTWYLSVYGASNESSSFQIVAALHATNRGMRVTRPPAVSRLFVNRPAAFGPPLPFDGEELQLVQAQPPDACAPLTNADAVRGRIALAARGDCLFTDKALAAQRAGARALVVSNSMGGLLYMVSNSMEAAANVTIPAVMIGHTDGAALRAALASSSVFAVLEQNGDRPRRLLEGIPQFGRVSTWQTAFYRFSVGGRQRDITFTLTPSVGSADLFVRRADDGLPPTMSLHDASSVLPGSLPDIVTIRTSDEGWCADCTYMVGVLGWAASEFILVASTDQTIISLQAGVPHLSHLETGASDFYRIDATNPAQQLRLQLTPLNGDPDLFVSTTVARPNATHHTWASTAFGSETLAISHADPNFRPGPFFVAVRAFANSTYTIVASVADDACLQLIDGQPQQGSLAQGEWACFDIAVGAGASALSVSLTPFFGDADLYLTSDGTRPSKSNWHFRSSGIGADQVDVPIGAGGPHACAGCSYQVGVYAFSASNFSLQATTSRNSTDDEGGAGGSEPHGERVLTDAIPAEASLAAGRPAFFSFYLSLANAEVQLRLTRLSGRATLHASFAQPRPTASTAQWTLGASGLASDAALTIGAADGRRCAPVPCALHLALETDGEAATASLLAFQSAPLELLALLDGRPQQDALAAGGSRYYAMRVPANATSLALSLTALLGDPDLFVSNAPGARPSFLNSTWSSARLGSDGVRIASTDPRWCADCTYTVGVLASTAANYSLVASTGYAAVPPIVALQAGVPLRVEISEPDGYAFFRFAVDDRAASVVLTATPFAGDPDVFASFLAERPVHGTPGVLSALSIGGDSLTISHYDSRFCPLGASAPCVLHVGVHAFGGNATFSLLARQAGEAAVALLDGVPQRGALELNRWQYYTLAVGATAERVRVSVTPSSGDPDLWVSTARFPTDADYEWKSALGGGESLTITPADEHWCAPCTYRIGVRAFTATNYSLVGSTGLASTLLEDGVPRYAHVAAGASDYYYVLVDDPATDLHLVLTPLSGNADLYVSHTLAAPNATYHEYASTALQRDAVSVSHYDAAMADCTAERTPRCAFYIAVAGVEASTYTLAARLSVASSGLRVDAPAAAAGALVFSNAVFGPPLPFEGESRPLALAAPLDGCAALTGGSLDGRVALVRRGGCTFIEKVRHAQAKGAAALLAYNDEDGPPVRMGASNASAAAGLAIPAVMVSRADGERLRGLLLDGQPVRLTLQQPGDRPLLLAEGTPQAAQVEASQMLYFSFAVGPEQAGADVTFTARAEAGGDVDIYVSSDGLPPTQSRYGALASRYGSDSLTLVPNTPPHCGGGCAYIVGLYGWSAANATLLASLSTGVATLQIGVPAAGRLAAGARASYRVFADDRADALRLLLTPLTGDPDLFVSTTVAHPDAAAHTWASTGLGDDAVYIAASDPRARGGLFYVGVVASGRASSYTLSAAVSGELRLLPGRPQRASLPAGAWQHFSFPSPPAGSAAAITLTVTPSFGDPDLYVSTRGRPTLAAHEWAAAASGGDSLTLAPSDAAWCSAPCTYHVGVHAWAATNFSVVQVVERAGEGCESGEGGELRLEDGLAVYAVARANASRCFALPVDRPDGPVALSLTPLSGEPRLSAGFGAPRAPEAELAGVVRAPAAGGASLLLTPACAAAAQAGGCSLHVRVRSEGPSTFSLAAAQVGSPVALAPGRPQYGSLRAGGWAYFSYAAGADAGGARPALTLALAAAFGEPRMYIRADGRVPTASAYTWAATAAGGDHLLIAGDDARACAGEPSCRFLIGVRAGGASNFSLTAYAHGGTVTLMEGLPLTAVAPARGCVELAIRSAGAPEALSLSLTALSGTPGVFVGAEPRPSAAAHLPGGSMRVDGGGGGELTVPLGSAPRSASYYVSVCAGADGAPARFVLSARLRAGAAPMLADGAPFAGSVAEGRLAEYVVSVGPDATRLQLSASPRSGGLALLLSPRGAGHDAPGARGSALSAALWRSASPGANTILARAGDAGWCAPCEYAVGVLGQPSANFSLLASVERAYTLAEGAPQLAALVRPEGGAEAAAYFAYALDEPVGFSLLVTVYSGAPEVYVSTSDPRPSAQSHEWALPAGGAGGGGGGAGGVVQLAIEPADARFCAGCTYYVAVLSRHNASVAVAASSERARTLALADGLPLAQSARAGEYLYYTLALGEGGGDLTVSVQAQAGARDLELYAAADGSQPSAGAHGWAGEAADLDGEQQLTIRAADPGHCAGCTYTFSVLAARASTFSIVATTAAGTTLLPLGLPAQRRVEAGGAAFFQALLDPRGPDALLALVPLRAPLVAHLSTSTTQPSERFSLAAMSAPAGSPALFRLDGVRLRQWCAERVLAADGGCPLYIAVRSGAADGAGFALSVSQGGAAVLIPGMPTPSAAEPGVPARFTLGAPAEGGDLSVSVSAAEPVSFELRVSTRGSAEGEEREDDDEEGWRAASDSSRGGAAGVLIAHDDPRACAAPCTYHVRVLSSARAELSVVASTAGGHTLLVEGSVVRASVAQGESALFKAYAPRDGKLPLLLTVHPCAGNPDLYVSDVLLAPGPPASFAFASAQAAQVERIRLAPAALSKLGEAFYIAVHGQTAASFTISASSRAEEEHAALAHAGPEGAEGVLEVVAASARRARVSWHAARALADGAAAPALDGDIEYRVELAEAAEPVVLFTACGVGESADTVATRAQADAGRDGRLSARLDGLRPGTAYQVNVLGSRKGAAAAPLLYRQVAFVTPGHAGALGGGAALALALGALLCCVLLGLALAVRRRRKQLGSLSLLDCDEAAVDMYHLGSGGQLEPAGPLVASPLFGGMAAAEEGTAPLAPYARAHEPTRAEEGLGAMLAASLDIHPRELEAGRSAPGGDEGAAGPAPSHRPLAASMDSDSDAGASGPSDDEGDGDPLSAASACAEDALMDSAAHGRSDQ